MITPRSPRRELGRREVLVAGGLGLLLAACAGDDADPESGAATAVDATTTTAEATTTSTSAAPAPSTTTAGPATTGPATTEPATTRAAGDPPPLTAADFDGRTTCQLTPEKTPGPFPLDEQFVRRDITEGYVGHPLRLGLRVIDGMCAPMAGAAVEVWHCDATGDYSAFADGGGGKDEAGGTTFLRGTQMAGDDGIVELLTIYPGWYRGRAVHIHLRVHLGDTLVLTSQLFFDGDYTAGVYAAPPYAEFGMPDTPNAADSIAGDPAAEGTLVFTTAAPTSAGPGTLGLLNLAVNPSARSGGPGGLPQP